MPTILIVDDDPVTLSVVAMQLKELGMQSHVASSGVDAAQQVALHQYSLVLMDVQMPHFDGLEATRAIRELQVNSGRPHLPIIAMTAEPDREKCLASGMDDFLFKPILLDDFRALLDRWLEPEPHT